MSQQPPEEPESEESEWKYGIDDVGPEAEPEIPEPDPIEPESVSLEHASFVVLGVVLTLVVVATAL